MGTMIPLYGYVNPHADEAPPRVLIERRDVLVASVNRLLDYVSREDVRGCKQRVMWANGFSPDMDEWTHAAVNEADRDTRPVLDDLLGHINMDGSIVVPTVEDILYPHSEMAFNLVERIISDGVPVISMNWQLDEHQSLMLFTDDHVADIRVFEYMWQNAMAVRRHLERFLGNRLSILRAYNEGVGRGGPGRPL